MKGRTTLKAIGNLTTTLLLILLLVTLFVVLATRASGGEPNLFGYQFKTVLSGSMEPEIQTGSIISIKQGGDPTRFEKDDVITFRSDDILITHRIIEVQESGQQYITQGDNNNGPDLEPVPADNVVGAYTGFTVPYVGYVIDFASSKQGTVLLLILPGVLLVMYAAVTIWRVLKRIEVPTNEEKS